MKSNILDYVQEPQFLICAGIVFTFVILLLISLFLLAKKGHLNKTLNYNLSIFASTLLVLLIIVGGAFILIGSFGGGTIVAIMGCISVLITLIAWYPAREWRVNSRREVEYDEFGISKSKGRYEYLSKQERDKIDLQKTADMERLVGATAIKKMTKKGSEHPMEDLKKMIGLKPVKEKVEEMVARMKFEKEELEQSKKKKKKKDNQPKAALSGRHAVFYGSPGTGKTTVARILTGFLYEYGYIKENKCLEIDGNFLKAGTESALKTELVVRAAYGGVLFIDEAYALMDSGDGSGEQVIATLIKQMEDNRDKFILIIAGYTREMKALIDQNPGFESRLKEYLTFPDYDAYEMRQIASSMANDQGFYIDNGAYDVYDEIVARERKLKSFGNGRTARNIIDKAIDRHTLNLARNQLPAEKRYTLCSIDFQNLQLGTIATDVRTAANSYRKI